MTSEHSPSPLDFKASALTFWEHYSSDNYTSNPDYFSWKGKINIGVTFLGKCSFVMARIPWCFPLESSERTMDFSKIYGFLWICGFPSLNLRISCGFSGLRFGNLQISLNPRISLTLRPKSGIKYGLSVERPIGHEISHPREPHFMND